MKPTLNEETEKRFDELASNFIISWRRNNISRNVLLIDIIGLDRVKQFISEVEATAEERGRLKGAGKERERIKWELPKIEVRQTQRYLSKSGFWSSRDLIDKNDVAKALNSERKV